MSSRPPCGPLPPRASLSPGLPWPQIASLPLGSWKPPREACLTCSAWGVSDRSLSSRVTVPGSWSWRSCPRLLDGVPINCLWVFSILVLVSCPIPHPHLPAVELSFPPSLWQPVLSQPSGLWQKASQEGSTEGLEANFLPEERAQQGQGREAEGHVQERNSRQTRAGGSPGGSEHI